MAKIYLDILTGHVYDFSIYQGKGNEFAEKTLGESYFKTVIDNAKATLCVDRFFTSVNDFPFAAVGTCIANRKQLPKIEKVLKKL